MRLVSSISGAARIPGTAATPPRHLLAPFRRGPVLWLILSGVFLVAAITIGTAVMVGQFRERALSNGERELENTVLLLSRHFDQEMEDAESVATNLISQLDLSGIASPETFRERMSGPDAHRMLKSKVSVLSYLDDVNIYDYAGELINSSGPWPPPLINISGRGYFQIFKANPPSETLSRTRWL